MPMLLSDASILAISSLSVRTFCCENPLHMRTSLQDRFHLLKDAKIAFGRSIPVALLGTVSIIAFCPTFMGLLSWVFTVLGHDPEVYYGPHFFLRLSSTYKFKVNAAVYRCPPIEPPPESRWAKRALELLHTTSTRLVVSSIVLFLVVVAPATLLVLNIYERREFKTSIKRELAKRVAVEEAILEDVKGSLECLVCFDHLSNVVYVAYDLAREKFFPLCHNWSLCAQCLHSLLCGLGIEPPDDLQANAWKAVLPSIVWSPSRLSRSKENRISTAKTAAPPTPFSYPSPIHP
ncbi:hypothetical protein C8J57DRAFT_1526467 [Mycena rebaudengoi]|nr:hypothetical protein C8J57DRAFT_1526467 [Mycena rebaudengoi]